MPETRAMSDMSADAREVTLLELVDRLLDRGVVLTGDITISVADVDLIVLGLRLILASAERLQQTGDTPGVVLSQPTAAQAQQTETETETESEAAYE